MDMENDGNLNMENYSDTDSRPDNYTENRDRSLSRSKSRDNPRSRSRSRQYEESDYSRSRSPSVLGEDEIMYSKEAKLLEEQEKRNRNKSFNNIYRRKNQYHSNRSRYHNRSMQPASTIPVIELEDAIHMNSYREFVLSNEDESITIDEAEQKYSEYCRRHQYQDAMLFFDHCANQEWIVEKYIPSFHKVYLKTIQNYCKSEIDFQKSLLLSNQLIIQSTVKEESTTTTTTDMEVEDTSSSTVKTTIIDGFPDHCVFIQNVPSTCTRQNLLDYLQQFNGLQRVYFGDPFHCPPSDLSRPVYVLFDTPENAQKAFKHMGGFHIPIKDTLEIGLKGLKEEEDFQSNLTFVPKCTIWKSYQHPTMINPRANTEERVNIDYQNCITLWKELSHYWNVPNDIIECIEKYQQDHSFITQRDMIDLLVYFLRRVFGYDYWLHENHIEFGVSFHHNGIDMIRSTEEVQENEGIEWCEELDRETKSFIESISNQSIEDELSNCSEIEQKEKELRQQDEQEQLKKYCLLREKEENYQCTICSKIFSTEHFAQKHIMNKHSQHIKIHSTKAVLQQLIRSDFLKDPSSKIPKIVSKRGVNLNNEPLPDIKNTREMSEMFISYANRYKDRDNVDRIQINTNKSVADVFDDF